MKKRIDMKAPLEGLRQRTLSNLQEIHSTLPDRPVPTSTMAELLDVKPDTLRRALCINGHYLGLTPIKMTNGRLLWRLQ
jgi:hypothetical protein